VFSLQRRMAAAGRYLTRRHVRWLSIVHQMLAQQLQDVNPDSEQRELALLQIASLYSLEDQIANAGNEMDDHPVTTSHLDEVFIIQQNVTFPAILREWLSAFCPVIAEEIETVSYTHLRAHETLRYLVCRLLLEKKKNLIQGPNRQAPAGMEDCQDKA